MKPMPWWDWLTLSPAAIRERGQDPSARFERTGHRRALSRRWARTVGYWALEDAKELITRAGLDYQSTADRARYDHFKYRWKVKTLRQTSDAIKENPEVTPRIALAENVYSDVAVALAGADPHCKKLPFGEAVTYAAKGSGVLPIEASLYYLGMLEVCDFHGFRSLDRYVKVEERSLLWEEAGVRTWLPTDVFAQYAQDDE